MVLGFQTRLHGHNSTVKLTDAKKAQHGEND